MSYPISEVNEMKQQHIKTTKRIGLLSTVGLLSAAMYLGITSGQATTSYLIQGESLSAVKAAVQASGFALHRHFNHNDLYHVIQMGGFYLLFRGGLLVRDRRPADEAVR